MTGPPSPTGQAQEHKQGHNPDEAFPDPPTAPRPESDTGLLSRPTTPAREVEDLSPENVDIFRLKAESALKLLCYSVDTLVQMNGDVPPTPTSRTGGTTPERQGSIAQGGQERKPSSVGTTSAPQRDIMNLNLQIPGARQSFSHEGIDSIPLKSVGSPESTPFSPQLAPPSENDVGYNAQDAQIQLASLARKFYSKRPPPISTHEYLTRIHKYCPMSTAVYLATSRYICHLTTEEKIIPLTPRNVHRLLLAGLRVAMKALEDCSWAHSRFAKVGGVSELELGKLEVSFCFLTDFGLKVDADVLQKEAQSLCRTMSHAHEAIEGISPTDPVAMRLAIPEGRIRHGAAVAGAGGGPVGGVQGSPSRNAEKRKASSALPSRPAFHPVGGLEATVNG